jgi:hypothetical protein
MTAEEMVNKGAHIQLEVDPCHGLLGNTFGIVSVECVKVVCGHCSGQHSPFVSYSQALRRCYPFVLYGRLKI